ncbi:V-type proton ATPase subunit F [Camellia lanceoleosa]|uniref:V-type proton ATPase subunit F n=1 Tax=Camellia lanceoleosa TaxID=1840588 RepID=A0ACC0G5A4_9ERIC|nr:V-type proton ATPase subunit F [Camellia lanceoleosa]
MAASGAQTNFTIRSNPAGDARLPVVGGLGGLGLPEMFDSWSQSPAEQYAGFQFPTILIMWLGRLLKHHQICFCLFLTSWCIFMKDTIAGFLLTGVGNVDLWRKTNYLIVDSKTTVKQIEEAFKEFTTREEVVIVMISQYVANMIKFLVDSYNNPILAILEIPFKDHPYDPTHDFVLSK